MDRTPASDVSPDRCGMVILRICTKSIGILGGAACQEHCARSNLEPRAPGRPGHHASQVHTIRLLLISCSPADWPSHQPMHCSPIPTVPLCVITIHLLHRPPRALVAPPCLWLVHLFLHSCCLASCAEAPPLLRAVGPRLLPHLLAHLRSPQPTWRGRNGRRKRFPAGARPRRWGRNAALTGVAAVAVAVVSLPAPPSAHPAMRLSSTPTILPLTPHLMHSLGRRWWRLRGSPAVAPVTVVPARLLTAIAPPGQRGVRATRSVIAKGSLMYASRGAAISLRIHSTLLSGCTMRRYDEEGQKLVQTNTIFSVYTFFGANACSRPSSYRLPHSKRVSKIPRRRWSPTTYDKSPRRKPLAAHHMCAKAKGPQL